MTTAYAIVRRALRLCRVIDAGEALPAAEAQDGLEALNSMLGLWRLEGLMAFDIERAVFAVSANTQTYAIGPGGTWNTTPTFTASMPRPVRIDHMGLIDTTVDPDLEDPMMPMTNAEYQDLRLKGLTSSWPTRWQYSPTVPLGSVFLWPAPTVNRSVAVYLWRGLSNWATIQTDLSLPDGYEQALVYNLAIHLAPEFGVATAAEVAAIATMSKALLMRNNSEPVVLQLDPLCPGQRRVGHFNELTGQVE